MDSFEGSRRLDPRAPLSPAERRSPRSPLPPVERRATRDGEPLEQRLDRWVSTGRQLVEGVSGGRPGSRPSNRRPEGRAGSRGGFDGLGRWVEDRLDWLLDDSDDWPEPWQESAGRRSEAPATGERPRRSLEAVSRRGVNGRPAAAADTGPATEAPEAEAWPDDSSFSVPRWQRPSPPVRRPDPLQTELDQRDPARGRGGETAPAGSPRPLPRSSRRR